MPRRKRKPLDKTDENVVIPKPVKYEDPISSLVKKSNQHGGKPAVQEPIRVFKKTIQTYWDARHLYYLDKWLKATTDELEEAGKRTDLAVAEYIIIRFLMANMATPHPALIKMVMEMSAGRAVDGVSQGELGEGTRTVKRIILEMPKSKRINEDK